MFVEVISQLEPGAGSSDLRLLQFLMSGCEGGFKCRPCYASGWKALTGFSVVEEEASLKEWLKRDSDDLLRGIRRVAGCCVFDVIFNLIKQVF